MEGDRYRRHNLKRRDRRAAERAAQRAWLSSMKSGPCLDCQGVFPSVCMDFDHRPGEVKLFGIGKNANGMSKTALMAEIEKCDLVCANCHRIRTHSRNIS